MHKNTKTQSFKCRMLKTKENKNEKALKKIEYNRIENKINCFIMQKKHTKKRKKSSKNV